MGRNMPWKVLKVTADQAWPVVPKLRARGYRTLHRRMKHYSITMDTAIVTYLGNLRTSTQPTFAAGKPSLPMLPLDNHGRARPSAPPT
jgi:hypothetical protein